MVKMVNETFDILTPIDGEDILRRIEEAGRICYQSTHKIEPGSSKNFVKMIMSMNPPHESVLEHVNITVKFITCRGMTHELVRQRIASYSQESTRFCDYCDDKFGNEITVIDQKEHIVDSLACGEGYELDDVVACAREACVKCGTTLHAVADWTMAMVSAEDSYRKMREAGAPAELARGVLPNDLKTEIVMTANLREWRHVFQLRTAEKAHFNIRGLMRNLCGEFKQKIPIVFDDIEW